MGNRMAKENSYCRTGCSTSATLGMAKRRVWGRKRCQMERSTLEYSETTGWLAKAYIMRRGETSTSEILGVACGTAKEPIRGRTETSTSENLGIHCVAVGELTLGQMDRSTLANSTTTR